jgi:hypothetical protein
MPQSDFFALGRTFVALLTGKEPLDLYDSFNCEVRWRVHAPAISPLLANLIDEMMAHKPAQRPANTRAILQKLSEIERKLYPPPATAPSSAPAPNPIKTPQPLKEPISIFWLLIATIITSLFAAPFIFSPLFFGYVIFCKDWFTGFCIIGLVMTPSLFIIISLLIAYRDDPKDIINKVSSDTDSILSLFYVIFFPFVFPVISVVQEFFSEPAWHFTDCYSSRSITDNLLAISLSSLLSGLFFAFYGCLFLGKSKSNKFSSWVKMIVIGTLCYYIGALLVFGTILVFNFKFQNFIEYVVVVAEFVAFQCAFQFSLFSASLVKTLMVFSTVSLSSLIGYYIPFVVLAKFISSDIIKTFIGVSICLVICTPIYLVKSENEDAKKMLTAKYWHDL